MNTVRVRSDRPLLGIGLALIFATMASHLDALSKWFAQHYPVLELIWIRYTAQLALLLAVMPWLGWRRLTGTSAPAMQVARGAALWFSATVFLAGLSFLPFATTKVLSQTAPMIVAAVSLPLLGETVGMRRWLAIVAGFAGLLVVLRPDFGTVQWAMLLPLGTACSYAAYQLITRHVTAADAALPSLSYVVMVGWVLASVAVPLVWVTPTWTHLAILIVHGLGYGLGHFVLISAISHAPASLIAPLGYTTLIWAVALGYVVFGEVPDAGTLLGGVLIAAAGIALTRSAAQGSTKGSTR